jgi:hypothetical protein
MEGMVECLMWGKVEVMKAVKIYCSMHSVNGKYQHILWDYQYFLYPTPTALYYKKCCQSWQDFQKPLFYSGVEIRSCKNFSVYSSPVYPYNLPFVPIGLSMVVVTFKNVRKQIKIICVCFLKTVNSLLPGMFMDCGVLVT